MVNNTIINKQSFNISFAQSKWNGSFMPLVLRQKNNNGDMEV